MDIETGAISEIIATELGSVDAPNGRFNSDFTRKVYVRNGDVFIKDLQTRELLQVTRSSRNESDARFMPDGKQVTYRVDNDFYIFDPQAGSNTQIAELRLEKDPLDDEESYNFLEQQQDDLFSTLRWEERRDKSAQRTVFWFYQIETVTGRRRQNRNPLPNSSLSPPTPLLGKFKSRQLRWA